MGSQGGYRVGAGRPKGARNMRSQELMARLQARFPEWCPIEQLAEAAQDASLDIATRLDCAAKVAAYVYPKPKSHDEDLIEVNAQRLFFDELAATLPEYERRHAELVATLPLGDHPPVVS